MRGYGDGTAGHCRHEGFCERLINFFGILELAYIKERSSETSVRNSSTMHWWNNFRIASAVRSAEFGELLLSGEGHYATTLTDGDKLIGISGTDNQLLAVLSWTAKVLNQNLPWKSVKDYANAIRDDRDAWKSSGWTVTEGTTNEIRWKE